MASKIVHCRESHFRINDTSFLNGEAEDPKYTTPFWIRKWAHSSNKRGFCYELCDRSVGILFDDCTQLIMDANGQQANFIDETARIHSFCLDQWPTGLEAKQKLLESFCKRRSQTEHNVPAENITKLDSLPRLCLWRLSKPMLVMQLTDGTVQVNFLADHTKIAFSPSLNSLSWIDCDRNPTTYRLQLLERHGCSKELLRRVHYAKSMIEQLISENEDCVSTLSQEGYDITRPPHAPLPLADCNSRWSDKFY